VPFCPDAIVIHAALLLALHPQPAKVVTSTDNVPPENATVSLSRLSE
jgi:hypothetical protein